MTLKKFKGPKSLDTIRDQCEAQDLILRRNRNDEFLSSFVVVSSLSAPEAAVYFSTVLGWFFGTTEDGTPFDSRKPPIEAPWFSALQEFFLEPVDEADSQAPQLNLGEAVFEAGAPDVNAFRHLATAISGQLPDNSQ